jgi:hypothetical protein
MHLSQYYVMKVRLNDSETNGAWVQQGFLLTPALIGSIRSNWADTHSRSIIVLRVYVSCVHIWIVHIFAVKKNGETMTPIDGPVSRYSITSILVRRTDRDTDGRTSFFSKTPRVRQLSSEKKKVRQLPRLFNGPRTSREPSLESFCCFRLTSRQGMFGSLKFSDP